MKKLIIYCLMWIPWTVFAQTSPILNYQGVLLDSDGQPVVDDTYSAVFELYATENAVSPLWNDTGVYITTVNGAFSIRLGAGATPIPTTVNFSNTLWLGIQISGSSFSSRVGIDPDPSSITVKNQVAENLQSLENRTNTNLQSKIDSLASIVTTLTNALQQSLDNRGSAVPVGTIQAFGGDTLSIPNGWLLCDGDQVSRSQYATLFEVIDEFWGEGDNVSTFHLPDLRGYFLRGVSTDTGRDPDKAERYAKYGGNAGEAVGSYQNDIFTSHSHRTARFGVSAQGSQVGSYVAPDYQNTDFGGPINTTIEPTGGSETRPINAYVYYIIKAF